MKECYDLKQQIEILVGQGKFQQFVRNGPGMQHPQELEQPNRAEDQPSMH